MEALWGRTGGEAERAAQKLGIPFHTSQVDSYLIFVPLSHQSGCLLCDICVCICIVIGYHLPH